MAAQRKASPSTLTGISSRPVPSGTIPGALESGQRVQTPIPESREQVTETGLDAREMGTAQARGDDTLNPRSGTTGRWDASKIPPTQISREAETEPAGPPPEDGLELEPTKSVGYYSLRAPRDDSVEIPRAPRLPQLDLDAVGLPPETYRPPRARTYGSAPQTIPQRQSFESAHPKTIRTPAPDADMPVGRSRRSSYPPPPLQESQTLTPPAPQSRSDRRSATPAPPRIYFAPHVRAQANQWAQTGSLSLPNSSSPRHARALQRALLLALLHEPGWYSLPQGLQQRAGWLFCDGWESNSDGHVFREIDDLATVLGLPAGPESRRLLSLAISGVVPDNFSQRPAPSSTPPSLR